MRMVRIQVADLSQDSPQQPDDRSIDDELRLLGRMAAGVIHDLNNYLGAIHATLTLLEQSPAERDLLSRALGCVDQAGRLTAALLAHLRGEDPPFEPVALGALVRQTLLLIERSLPPAIETRVEIADELPPIRGVRS